MLITTMFLLSFAGMISQVDKDKLFEKIKLEYEQINSISLKFTLNDNKSIRGDLIAKKGNKYVLTIANRKIYCDGTTIWNYVPENKSVLVSNYESNGESASIEKIFFDFTKNFEPLKLYKSQSAGGSTTHILELIPSNDSPMDITMIKLSVNIANNDINAISIMRNYAEESWVISNLKLNPTLADTKFEFKPIENVEIIDLR